MALQNYFPKWNAWVDYLSGQSSVSFSDTILVRITLGVLKHPDQKQLGEEKVYLSYTSTSLFTIKEQELKMGRNLEAGEILLTGSLSLLYYRNQNH